MAGNCARYSILIVDDKELDRNGVCYLIQQYGLDLHPIPAASGSEALEILRQNRAKLDEIAQYLYEKETITGEEFMRILRA